MLLAAAFFTGRSSVTSGEMPVYAVPSPRRAVNRMRRLVRHFMCGSNATRALAGAWGIGWSLLVLCACADRPPRMVKSAPRSGADRVLVVVNARSESSERVGRYYMQRRNIAASHLVRVDVPIGDEISALEFRRALIDPVRDAIDSLPQRIDFIVLTTGVPLRIAGGSGYAVDAHLAGMRLSIPPMVGFDSTWLATYRNPYFNAREPFNSDRFAMYLVTRLDCAVVTDCFRLIDHSVDAQPVRGPFFFDAKPQAQRDNGYRAINNMLYAAAFRLQLAGLETQLDTTMRFVAPAAPVMGYASWGSNDEAFDSTTYHAVRFLPGALAETYVSTSARTFGPTTGGQSRIVDLIAQGVTGVKGYVSEPYSIALANPDILFERYVRGYTLAEAFYAASRMVMWKDVVIGDPLCAPYATMSSR